MDEKIASDARVIMAKHSDVSFDQAYQLVHSVWEEAQRLILKEVSAEEWSILGTQDKSMICSAVIRQLTDEQSLKNLINRG